MFMVLQCLSTQVQFLVLNRSRKISLLPYSTQTTEIAYWLRADASPKKKEKTYKPMFMWRKSLFPGPNKTQAWAPWQWGGQQREGEGNRSSSSGHRLRLDVEVSEVGQGPASFRTLNCSLTSQHSVQTQIQRMLWTSGECLGSHPKSVRIKCEFMFMSSDSSENMFSMSICFVNMNISRSV